MTRSRDIANSTSTLDVDGGTIKLDGNYPVGTDNVALGDTALDSLTSGNFNTVFGAKALTANTEGSFNVAVGRLALTSNTTGQHNAAIGSDALQGNTTGSYNTALGNTALGLNTTADANTAVGYQAGYNNTTGQPVTATGYYTLNQNTTGSHNTAYGYRAMRLNTTGSYNTASGSDALYSNTTSDFNTATGYQALYSTTGGYNAAFGDRAGYSVTSGIKNTFLGQGCGYSMTTGSKNTIIGNFGGNQGGLDIRTSSNNIVLSDGEGNIRQYIDQYGNVMFPSRDSATVPTELGINTLTIQTTDSGCPVIYSNDDNNIRYRISFRKDGTTIGSIVTTGSNTAYNTSSDHRLKENVNYTWDATTRLKQLKPARFNFIADGTDTVVDGFIAHEAQAVVPESVSGTHNEVDEDGNPEYQGIDHSKLVPLLVKTIQELEARITALEA
jgi:hypothetical protein